MWAGDVEIHVRASDWHRHGHDGDKAYDSVILHVVSKDDAPVRRSDGNVIPQMKMSCSPSFNESYRRLVASAADDLPCHEEFKTIDNVRLYSWLDNLAYERLYNKSERINRYLSRFSGDWESTCYVTLARALGFGVNSEPFERLALSVPLRFVGKHSDSALSIEALLFGQSGLLDEVGDGDSYVELLKKEYDYLARNSRSNDSRGSGGRCRGCVRQFSPQAHCISCGNALWRIQADVTHCGCRGIWRRPISYLRLSLWVTGRVTTPSTALLRLHAAWR